jgi:integrase
MTKPRYLRHKKAKGRDYWYFDAGKRPDGSRELLPLPHIKDPSFGGALARAQATRTNRKNRQGILTLDGLIRLYEKSPKFRSRAEATRRNYSTYLAKANSLIRSGSGESPPAKLLERSDILALMDKLADTPGAANQAVRALGALYAWAVDTERVKESPVRRITYYESTPHQPWPEALLEEALDDPQVGMAVALLYFTGQRINEAIKMSWADIHGDHMRVYVQKKRNHISVAILSELAERLAKVDRNAITILTNANGRPWTQGGLRQKLQQWAKERGHHVVPHGLRKNAVISLLEAGCSVYEVSGITDQSPQMVEHYAQKVNKLTLGRAAVIKLDAHRRARNKAGK